MNLFRLVMATVVSLNAKSVLTRGRDRHTVYKQPRTQDEQAGKVCQNWNRKSRPGDMSIKNKRRSLTGE
jgi:hypothetical protein